MPQRSRHMFERMSMRAYLISARIMFYAIGRFIDQNSFGPASALFSDVGEYRFIQILPYNYYLYFVHSIKTIHLLLPKTLESSLHKCNDNRYKTMVAKFTVQGLSFGCTNYTENYIHSIIARNENQKNNIMSTSKTLGC